MKRPLHTWLFIFMLMFGSSWLWAQPTLITNNVIQPTCTAPNSGQIDVELIMSLEDTVVFVLSAFPSSGGMFTQTDTTTLKTITYPGLEEGSYFINVFVPGIPGDHAPGILVLLDITEPVITVPPIPVTVCSNDGPQDLLALVSADQPGGTFSFSGPGVSGTNFDPSGLSGFENVTVTYDLGVCSVINTIIFDVEPAPVVIPFPISVCEDNGLVDLNTLVIANIPGGAFTFSGTGVSGTDFDPSGLSGPITVTATYVLNNCTVIEMFDITVQTLPVLTLSDTTLCDNIGVVDLTTIVSAVPGGGTWNFAGPGVSGNNFDPAGLSGAQLINVQYSQGLCNETGSFTITVETAPILTLTPTSPLCENSGAQDLLTMVSANPVGGAFSFAGPGVSGTSFDPAGLGGTSANIDVTYVLGSCTVVQSMTIDVETTPVLTLTPITPLCENAGTQDLLTMVSANLPGGAFTFSGPGVAGTSFDPIGLGGTTANIDVTYVLGACTVTDILVIDIESTPVLTLNPTTPLCANAGLQNLLTMVSANPPGGTFSFSGTGVSGNNFDPFGLSGPINIDVTYVLGVCSVTETMAIDVEPTPILTLNPVSPVCDADSPYDLSTMVSANPAGGAFTFSGPGVSGNQFDPMGQSNMVNISVTYVLGACTVNEVMIIEVEQAPVLTLNPVTPLCVNAGPQDISTWVTANPAGGAFTFTGPGVSGTTFDPAGLNGFVNIDIEYTLGACIVMNTMVIDVQALPTVTFNPPAEICNDQGLLDLLTIVSVNPTGGTLTFSGAGVIGNNFNPTGLVGVIDIQVTYTLSSCTRIDTLQLNLNDAATVNAGPDQVVCETDDVFLAGTFGGGATSVLWTSTGTGLFDDNTSPNAIYTPSLMDRSNGSVILTLITNDPDGAGPCSVESSSLTVTFNPAAVVDAGVDQTICEGDDALITGTVSGASTNPVWTTLGGGSFADATALSTTYFPDASDITTGSVQLVLVTDDPDGPGGCPVGSDTLDIIINPIPQVDAGTDQAIPAGDMVNLAGIIGGSATSSTWSSNGTGIFDDITSLNAVYTPSAADIIAGSVILILTTNDPDGPGPCTAQSDLMTVLIVTGNTVIAGADQTLCEGENVFLNGIVACIANGTTWTTTGTGTFADPDALNTIYVPSAADIAADSILMILNIDDPGSSLGCVPTSDTLVVKINPSPVADAGLDVTICQGDSTQLTGSGGMTYLWSPAAGLNDATLASPMASPMNSTIYTLTVTDAVGCTDTSQVTVDVIITLPPAATSPVDICQDFLAPRLMATGIDLKWYTDPGLSNLVANGPEYQPGPGELDVTVVGSTTFYVTQDVGCGESTATQVVVNVFDRNDAICSTLCPTVDFTAVVTDVVCFGDNTGIIDLTNIVGSGGSSPLLDILVNGNMVTQTDQSQFSITGLAAGDYDITVQQTGVCTNFLTTTITVGQPAQPLQVSVIDAVMSLPDQPTGLFTVIVQGGSGTPPIEVSINLTVPAFPPQSHFVDFLPAVLNPSTGNYEITFQDLYAGTYEITTRDGQGCVTVVTQLIEFDPTIFIPNIFTPNGDNVNETFFIRNLPSDATLVISNRWGKIVYEASNYQNDWDGEDHSDGTYFYRLVAEGTVYKGWVEIWRGNSP
ncbi:MAG: gliding motility-associated C-terminal domain-containing protein [Cyclobacteriaceae bacterium]|nr:gliding motility-associated C-terminal domain-containing protein [Cyclobacteriaceae bacterium]